jgi:hypothetical protein
MSEAQQYCLLFTLDTKYTKYLITRIYLCLSHSAYQSKCQSETHFDILNVSRVDIFLLKKTLG